MTNLTKETRAALKIFGRIVITHKLSFALHYAKSDWKNRHSGIEDTLKQCETSNQRICYVRCPTLNMSAFVTFRAEQEEPTDEEIVQALRLELIRRSEAQHAQ